MAPAGALSEALGPLFGWLVSLFSFKNKNKKPFAAAELHFLVDASPALLETHPKREGHISLQLPFKAVRQTRRPRSLFALEQTPLNSVGLASE